MEFFTWALRFQNRLSYKITTLHTTNLTTLHMADDDVSKNTKQKMVLTKISNLLHDYQLSNEVEKKENSLI